MTHPIRFLFEEINRDYWGMPRNRQSDVQERREVPVRPRFHPLQRLTWLPDAGR